MSHESFESGCEVSIAGLGAAWRRVEGSFCFVGGLTLASVSVCITSYLGQGAAGRLCVDDWVGVLLGVCRVECWGREGWVIGCVFCWVCAAGSIS